MIDITKTKIIGADPGFSGAIAVYDLVKGKIEAIYDMPLTDKTRRRKPELKEIDIQALGCIVDLYKDEVGLAIIERVGAFPKDGVVSAFRFGEGFGVLRTVISLAGIHIEYPLPSVWKTAFGLSGDKQLSIDLARKRFPEAAVYFMRKKDDGRAEAALLATIGVSMYKKELERKAFILREKGNRI